MRLQHYLKVGHAKRHHMGQLLSEGEPNDQRLKAVSSVQAIEAVTVD